MKLTEKKGGLSFTCGKPTGHITVGEVVVVVVVVVVVGGLL